MALAAANGSDRDNTRASFPITRDYGEFHGHHPPGESGTCHVSPSGTHLIRDLSETAQAFVEGMPRHERWETAAHLFELGYLDNRDKPRVFNPVPPQPTACVGIVGLEVAWDQHVPADALVEGAHLASIHFAPDNLGMEMQMPLVAAISVDRSTGGFIPLDEISLYASTAREIVAEAQAVFFS